MSKLYGYKDGDARKFAEFLKRHKGTLSSAFAKFAESRGKSKGTVRNMYYAMVKKAETDEKFKKEYFGDIIPAVRKNQKFGEEESRELLIKILRAKAEGKSVRSTVSTLADGDTKTALRFQNKYRALMKNKKPNDNFETRKTFIGIPSNTDLQKLKDGIDGLIGRISEKAEKENKSLRQRLEYLEKENLRLCNILYGGYRNGFGGNTGGNNRES